MGILNNMGILPLTVTSSYSEKKQMLETDISDIVAKVNENSSKMITSFEEKFSKMNSDFLSEIKKVSPKEDVVTKEDISSFKASFDKNNDILSQSIDVINSLKENKKTSEEENADLKAQVEALKNIIAEKDGTIKIQSGLISPHLGNFREKAEEATRGVSYSIEM